MFDLEASDDGSPDDTETEEEEEGDVLDLINNIDLSQDPEGMHGNLSNETNAQQVHRPPRVCLYACMYVCIMYVHACIHVHNIHVWMLHVLVAGTCIVCMYAGT